MGYRDEGLIYYLLDASRLQQRVKIGTTTHLADRLVQLRSQTSSGQAPLVLALEVGGVPVEAELHARFADYRLFGEWFEYVPGGPLAQHIAAMPNPRGWLMDTPEVWRWSRGALSTPDYARWVPPSDEPVKF